MGRDRDNMKGFFMFVNCGHELFLSESEAVTFFFLFRLKTEILFLFFFVYPFH